MIFKNSVVRLALSVATFSLAVSCSDRGEEPPVVKKLETKIYKNLDAAQEGGMRGETGGGKFTKFSFAKGEITTDNKKWDIAFRGTNIIVNGGTELGISDEPERTGDAAIAIVKGTFDDVKEVTDNMEFKQDGKSSKGHPRAAIPRGSGNGWYFYDSYERHVIVPIAGKIFVVRTVDGKYAKFQVLSYYKDSPKDSELNAEKHEPRYYTFKYVYQPDGKKF